MPDNYLAPTGDTFPDVYQIEEQDSWVGGPNGLANKQGLSLAERTQFLELQRQAHAAAADPHPQYMTEAETGALIEARVGDFSLDIGTANAKVVALNPAIIAYADNFGGSFKNLLLNTGPVTIDFGGGAVPLVSDDGSALIGGDLPAGAVVGYQYIHADGQAYVTNMVKSQTDDAGKISFFARKTAPSGYLKANGTAVSVAAYPNLSNAIYVGDADNATALSGYKCTDPLNQSTTRDIAGAYIVLPDMRGEFPRGWDDGRGVDAGRVLGSAQAQDIQPHTHAGVVTTLLGNNGGTGAGTQEIPSYGSTSSTGTTETRPRNIAWLACIKF